MPRFPEDSRVIRRSEVSGKAKSTKSRLCGSLVRRWWGEIHWEMEDPDDRCAQRCQRVPECTAGAGATGTRYTLSPLGGEYSQRWCCRVIGVCTPLEGLSVRRGGRSGTFKGRISAGGGCLSAVAEGRLVSCGVSRAGKANRLGVASRI